jgi:hypothetical protein
MLCSSSSNINTNKKKQQQLIIINGSCNESTPIHHRQILLLCSSGGGCRFSTTMATLPMPLLMRADCRSMAKMSAIDPLSSRSTLAIAAPLKLRRIAIG